jgi:hypothetical protein
MQAPRQSSKPAKPAAGKDEYLAFYTKPPQSNTWSFLGPIKVNGVGIRGVTGDPALIQSTRGDNGYFEMLVPQGRKLVHYVRDNDLPFSPWRQVADVIAGTGPIVAAPVDVALIQSTLRNWATNTGNLEAIVRMHPVVGDDYLEQYSFNAGTNTWRAIGRVRVNGKQILVTGKPSLIQSTYGNPGNFEILVPEGQNVIHYFNDRQDRPEWHRVAALYPPTTNAPGRPIIVSDRVLAVSIIQSTFNQPGNFEAVIYRHGVIGHSRNSSSVDTFFFDSTERHWKRIGPLKVGNNVVHDIVGF